MSPHSKLHDSHVLRFGCALSLSLSLSLCLCVRLIRHLNLGEQEMPRFSLIRPRWRFPDKPVRSRRSFLILFCRLHIRTAVFFTTIELRYSVVSSVSLGVRGTREAAPAQNSIALFGHTVEEDWRREGRRGEPFPIFNASIVTRHTDPVGNRRVWRARTDADGAKLARTKAAAAAS